jgi:hopanoid biosynthesis associated protein HpnK
VNEAVHRASSAGVLTAASLMVAAPAAADAIARARTLPNLRVGLHVVLADGLAMSAPDEIAALADREGRMDGRMFSRGLRFFAGPRVRRQLAAEIRAQFDAFARTGLPLDHVNAHKHFHLHPSVLELLLRIGRDYGMRAIRVPDEPMWFAGLCGGWAARAGTALLRPWVALMKIRLHSAGILHNDRIFGVAASGAMVEDRILAALARLPHGITEIYSHPAVAGHVVSPSMSGYQHAAELDAFMSPRVRTAIEAAGIGRGGFVDAPGPGRRAA